MKLKDVLKYLIPPHQKVDLYDHPFENKPIKNISSRLEQTLKAEILERLVQLLEHHDDGEFIDKIVAAVAGCDYATLMELQER